VLGVLLYRRHSRKIKQQYKTEYIPPAQKEPPPRSQPSSSRSLDPEPETLPGKIMRTMSETSAAPGRIMRTLSQSSRRDSFSNKSDDPHIIGNEDEVFTVVSPTQDEDAAETALRSPARQLSFQGRVSAIMRTSSGRQGSSSMPAESSPILRSNSRNTFSDSQQPSPSQGGIRRTSSQNNNSPASRILRSVSLALCRFFRFVVQPPQD